MKTGEKAQQTIEERQEDSWDATPYCENIEDAKKVFESWNTACDNARKAYADLDELRAPGDPEFNIFYANMEVIKPSIYARAPVPIVTPAFKSRDPLIRQAAEVVERAAIANQRKVKAHKQYKLARDDLALFGRGVVWGRLDKTKKRKGKAYECAPVEHLLRKNFLHDPQQNWALVGWVARGSWWSDADATERFGERYSRDDVTFVTKESDTADDYVVDQKFKVWEIWDKHNDKVIWVPDSGKKILDQGPPPIDLEDFFPCPEPAYSTIQPETLIPIPDWLFYADQVEEINEYTRRINDLTTQLKLKGFYEAGASNIADAVKKALESNDSSILVGITGLSAIDGGRDIVQWLPLGDIVKAIAALVDMREQAIEAVYQITGISDIMRGDTQASETLGAQNLKAQFGNVRIRNRQEEMVRLGHETTEIVSEIAAENFSIETLMMMTRVELPREADIKKMVQAEIKKIKEVALQAVKQMRQQPPATPPGAVPVPPQGGPAPGPQGPQGAPPQAPPDPIAMARQQEQQLLQQADQEITWEKIQKLLRDERLAPFMLDIETDSTIQANEQAEKQLRTEFTTAVGGFMLQATQLLTQAPETGPLIGELLQFMTAPYRPGRQMEATIDELVETMAGKAKAAAESQGGPSPEEIAAQADAKKASDEGEAKKMEAAEKGKQGDADRARMAFEASEEAKSNEAQRSVEAQATMDKHTREIAKIEAKSNADIKKLTVEGERDAARHARDIELKDIEIQRMREAAAADQQKHAAALAAARAKPKGETDA